MKQRSLLTRASQLTVSCPPCRGCRVCNPDSFWVDVPTVPPGLVILLVAAALIALRTVEVDAGRRRGGGPISTRRVLC
jgi:hypothetical protein